MSNAAKLKKRAVELEQKKQFDKALTLYIQFLHESEGVLDDIDIPLYNRVGDLMLRTGNATDALNYYEKAVELYAERGFLNNAIALCNKVLRQSPGRASIYYKLGKISATKGFKSDAKKNFLEYADRMQKTGQIDEAFRALKEFADLCPDQDDIRLMLAEQLSKENRQDEAMEQLQKLHDKLDSEGRSAEARATVDRMKSIDPEAVPRVSGTYRSQKSTDLIFLDTSFEQASRSRAPAAPAAPATPPQPATRQVSDPDLVMLTLADQLDVPVSPVHNPAIADAFVLDVDVPNDESGKAAALPMLDVGEIDELPSAAVVDGLELTSLREPTPPEALESMQINAQQDPAPVDLANDVPTYVSGPPLGVDYASDLAADSEAPPERGLDDLFDFRAPPRSDGDTIEAIPSVNLDPDVAFPSFDLDDMALPSADEVTSGGSLAAALGAESALGPDVSEFDLSTVSATDPSLVGNDIDAIAATPTARPTDGTELEWSLAAPSEPPPIQSIDEFAIADDVIAQAPLIDIQPETSSDAPASAAERSDIAVEFEVDALVDVPAEVDAAPSANAIGSDSLTTTDVDTGQAMVPEWGETSTPPTAIGAIASTPTPLSSSEVLDRAADGLAGWEVQRARAERLLEAGNRAAGVQLLEEVAADLERIGVLERALTIVDELIRLSPDSIRHHQKRVELAFRAGDRAKLIDAYIELGDVLFRSGEERKARAVYQRVLELAPDDPRAQAAIESVAFMGSATASGSMPAIAAPSPAARAPNPPARPNARDTHVPYHSHPGAASRPGSGIAAPPPTRKPSPLDRSAATNGEFVDLGEWLRSGDSPKSTRMVAEEKPPTGDEQADFQEMLKRFKQGIAENVDDEDYESHYDLGVAYKEMGLMDEAVAEFQKALRGTSNRVRAYEALGQCFVEKEQFHVAASVLSRAIALGVGDDHHLVGVLYLLGRATEALSKHGAALDYYQRVFAVDIEFRDVAERISAIERKDT
jgi:tetratricopeptide (TPR) repeat protein